jgi:hypothetical protein
MKENQKKAFDFAADTTKQLITISTAIITLTVTFSKDILGGAENITKPLLIWTWVAFICSIIFGVVTLMTLTGTLQPMNKCKNSKQSKTEEIPNENIDEDECKNININNGNIRMCSILQAIFFILAIIMTGIFGYKSLATKNVNITHKNSYPVIRQTIFNKDTTTKYIDTLFIPH